MEANLPAANLDLAAPTAYVALEDFTKETKGVARAAFHKQPDMLEKLRLVD